MKLYKVPVTFVLNGGKNAVFIFGLGLVLVQLISTTATTSDSSKIQHLNPV
jgi:hypothetical protein